MVSYSGDNDGNAPMAVGTHTHLYILKGGVLYDVTPIISSGNLSNAFSVTNGSPTVTVTSAAHGMVDGNRIILGAASFNVSWAAGTEFTITFINTNSFSITALATPHQQVPL